MINSVGVVQAKCFFVLLQKGHGKKIAQLTLFPPTACFKYECCCKESYYEEKLFLFRKPLPSLLKTTQVQHLKPGSAKEAYLSSTQHAGDFLCPTYNTLVCTAQHNVCSLCNAVTSGSACVPNSPLWGCCLSNPHPLSTYTPDCSYQSLIICILS